MSSRSAERGLFGLAVLGLAILSVRPVGVAEKALDVALLPVRLLSEAARPVGLLRVRQVRAAESELEQRRDSDFERRQNLFRTSELAVLPDTDLFERRRFVLAEVVERDQDRIDWVKVDLESHSAAGIEPGLPVVAGHVYVGRVESVDPVRAQAVVALITGKDTFVGARIDPEDSNGFLKPVHLVVGGVTRVLKPIGVESGFLGDRAVTAAAPTAFEVAREEYQLAVHNPSQRDLPRGLAVVDERLAGGSGLGYLANGFLLGRPVENEGDSRRRNYGIEPLLDYKSGLFQLVIVCPLDIERGHEEQPIDVLVDPDAWFQVAVTSSGDPSGWRESLKLGGGWWDGVHTGAALVSGSYLVGRVKHAGVLSADVSLLGDPGFHVPALAHVEGRDEPLVLGSLVTLGRDPSGEHVRFRWNAREPRTVDAPVRAEIFTGSGELRVPRGLLLGVTELPAGRGPHEITVEQPVDTRHVRRLFVRVDSPELPPRGPEGSQL